MRNADEVLVRETTHDDLPRVRVLAEQLGYPLTDSRLRERWDEVRRVGSGLAVAEGGSAGVIGWIEVRAETSLLGGRRARVAALVVDEHQRGAGVGRALLAWAEGWASQRGCDGMVLTSNVERVEAHAFYDRLAWTRRKTSHVYVKLLDMGGGTR